MSLGGIHGVIWLTCKWNLSVSSPESTAPTAAGWPPWLNTINPYSRSKVKSRNWHEPHSQQHIPDFKTLHNYSYADVFFSFSFFSPTEEQEDYFPDFLGFSWAKPSLWFQAVSSCYTPQRKQNPGKGRQLRCLWTKYVQNRQLLKLGLKPERPAWTAALKSSSMRSDGLHGNPNCFKSAVSFLLKLHYSPTKI